MVLSTNVLVVVFVSVLCEVGVCVDQLVTVSTQYGQLQGVRTAVDDQFSVDKYLAIPYAKPPVGNLRFAKPQAFGGWSGVRDATSFSPQCPQPPVPPGMQWTSFPDSEDCLYLNVYTPKVNAGNTSFPVMVWIHGGGFYMGSGGQYDPTELVRQGVVVVTINYRLGALGFLSTEDANSPGNYGLWDQIMALQWVRDAISAFNGNPDDVTIFGESAGSGSVSLLLLFEEGRGLFKKAIMESGTSLGNWATSLPHPKKFAQRMASALNCSAILSTPLLQCLRSRNWQSMLNTTIEDVELPFRPVPECRFGLGQSGLFSDEPDVILSSGRFNSNLTVIRGFNKDEGFNSLDQMLDIDNNGVTVEEFRNFTTGYFKKHEAQNVNKLVDLVFKTYVGNRTDPILVRAAAGQFISDYNFVVPTIREFQLAAKGGMSRQYMYRFSYRSPNRMNHLWQGVVHADELSYVFGNPLLRTTLVTPFVSTWTLSDLLVSQNMVTMWTNFAKYGDPTPENLDGVRWLPWMEDNPRLLDINLSLKMADSTLPPSLLQFWSDVIPKLAYGNGSGIIG